MAVKIKQKRTPKEKFKDLLRNGVSRLPSFLKDPVIALSRKAGFARSVRPNLIDLPPVTVIVSGQEICDKHGTGVLLRKLLQGEDEILHVRARTRYGGECSIESPSKEVEWEWKYPTQRVPKLCKAIGKRIVKNVIVVPYKESELEMAGVICEMFGAKLIVWVMDDNCVESEEMDRGEMQVAIDRADIVFGISWEMCEAYNKAFGKEVYLLPPIVEPGNFPKNLSKGNGKALMVGNVWSPHWMARLREAISGIDLEIDWYGSPNRNSLGETLDGLEDLGIHLRGFVPESELLKRAREFDFVIVPTSEFDDDEDASRIAIAKLSLPSRIPTLMAATGIPIVVIGDEKTAAAHFVTQLGIGKCCPYNKDLLVETFKSASAEEFRHEVFARSRDVSQAFSCEGLFPWMLQSAELGSPKDDRFESLGSEGQDPDGLVRASIGEMESDE